MKLTVETDALRTALATAMLPIKANAHAPILEHVQIIASEARLRLIGTDGMIEAQAFCEAAVGSLGRACIHAQNLKALLPACGETATLSGDDAWLTLTSGPVNARLPISMAEFPRKPKPDGETEIPEAASALAFCVGYHAKEEFKVHQGGVRIDPDYAVATDGHHMAWVKISGGADGKMVSGRHVPLILKVMGQGGRLFVSGWTWRVETEGAAMMGPLVNQPFDADWARLRGPGTPLLFCAADELRGAIEAASMGHATDVFIEVSNEAATVSGSKFQKVAAETKITVPCEGRDTAFVVSTKYLLQTCRSFAGLNIDVSTDGRALFFRARGNDQAGVAVMALRDARSNLPVSQEAA